MTGKVVVISPSPFSRYTLATLYLLERQGVTISGVVLNRLLNIPRLKREFQRDGARLIRKVYRKLVLRSSENPSSGEPTIVDYMQAKNMPMVTVPKFCRDRSIDLLVTNNLNQNNVQTFLEEKNADCIPFTGGGLIRQAILDRAGMGVVNCHMGILPYYRGMDVVQWPIIDNRLDQIGLTTHIMDAGVDTGDILRVFRINTVPYSRLADLRNHMECQMPDALVKSCMDLINGVATLRAQETNEGTQHFIMNWRLSRQIDDLLSHQARDEKDTY